jgi:hypothetical protein
VPGGGWDMKLLFDHLASRLSTSHECHILAGTSLFRPLEHCLGSVALMKPGSNTHLIVLK